MTFGTGEGVPLACSLTADELQARGVENESLLGRATSVSELTDGYSFGFLTGDELAQELLRFVLNERACCPFFTFELTFPSPHTTVWLNIRGREGVKEIARELMLSSSTQKDG